MSEQTTITRTAEQLRIAQDNDLDLYWTPGADAPYWASRASFRYDKVVATVQDFLEAAGFDLLDGFEADYTFTLEVAAPEPVDAATLVCDQPPVYLSA